MATTTIVGQRWKVYVYADSTALVPGDGEAMVLSGVTGFESSRVMIMGDGTSTVAQLVAAKQYQAVYAYADVDDVVLAAGYQYAVTDIPGSTIYVQIITGDGTHTVAELVANINLSLFALPIGFVYFQGPNDADPATLYPGTVWDDVSWEEANMTRRTVGDLAGAFFAGVPAHLAYTVAGGVPTVTITNGGSGYLSGGSGTITLTLTGTCSTQATRTATVTNGVITAINVVAAGAGYTSGAVAVYDGIVGHGDLVQFHQHGFYSFETAGSQAPLSGGIWFGQRTTLSTLPDGAGTVRTSAETSTAWAVAIKFRRTA